MSEDDNDNDDEDVSADAAFAVNLLASLVPLHNAKDKAVRLRVCQLVSGLLNGLGEDAEISDELWALLEEALLFRLKDKVPAVRCAAVAALKRLQDPSDVDDAVISEYLRLLSCDTSKDVRKAVLAAVGVTRATLPQIVARVRDVRPDVRAAAFEVLGEHVLLEQLSIEQRASLLESGLRDRWVFWCFGLFVGLLVCLFVCLFFLALPCLPLRLFS